MNIHQKLRLEVLERDEYLCQDCGKYTTETHHIISRGRENAWRECNLITLCPLCHKDAGSHETKKRHLQFLREKHGYEYTGDLWLQALEEA